MPRELSYHIPPAVGIGSAKGMTAAHRFDARLKLIACLVYVIAVVTTPPSQWMVFCLYLGPILAVLFLAGLPLGKTLAKSTVVIPFTFIVAAFMPFFTEGRIVATFHIAWIQANVTQQGLVALGEVLCKSWLSVLGLVLLSSITTERELVAGMRRLGLPSLLADTLVLTVRYLTLFADEAKQMERARRCRALKPWHRWGMRSAAGMVASLFIRAYETGERVHLAMLSRGFDGEMREAAPRSLSLSALAACAFITLVVVGIRVWGNR
jgi:cobalt/nickel transport system permease protein